MALEFRLDSPLRVQKATIREVLLFGYWFAKVFFALTHGKKIFLGLAAVVSRAATWCTSSFQAKTNPPQTLYRRYGASAIETSKNRLSRDFVLPFDLRLLQQYRAQAAVHTQPSIRD